MIVLAVLWIIGFVLALVLLVWELGPWFKVSEPASRRQMQEASPEENARPLGNVDVLPGQQGRGGPGR